MGTTEWLTFCSWIVLSILIVGLDHGLKSSNFQKGFTDSLVPAVRGIPLISGALCVIWLFLISRIYRSQKTVFVRYLLTMLPVVVFSAWTCWNTPSPEEQFAAITGVELPSEIGKFESWQETALFSKKQHTFYFKSSPTEITRLINELGWSPSLWEHNKSWIEKFSAGPSHNLAINSWTNPQVYIGPLSKGDWSFSLVTDKQQEQVFILFLRSW